jgi:hypothetical protein
MAFAYLITLYSLQCMNSPPTEIHSALLSVVQLFAMLVFERPGID